MHFRNFVAEHAKSCVFETGAYAFRQGEANRSLYLIKSGLLKAYYVSSDGKENIKSFLFPEDVIGSLKGIYGASGCSFSLVCLYFR